MSNRVLPVKFSYKVTKMCKDPKDKSKQKNQTIECKGMRAKVTKDAYVVNGFVSEPQGLPKDVTREELVFILERQVGGPSRMKQEWYELEKEMLLQMI